eukprot:TRINITY_DN71222_c1_g1_i1.p1 TRINITY_DN71222_c1_g1~~TRINITY_DN71222_c1_g1_i1.p1  ORF type:complete len:247 (-),score=10.72 TRINITY_DN71222_c1_g1_i1:126-866(-)
MSALVRITTGIMPQHSRVGMSRAMSQFGEVIHCHKPPYSGIAGEDFVNVRFATQSAADAAYAALKAGQVFVDGFPVGVGPAPQAKGTEVQYAIANGRMPPKDDGRRRMSPSPPRRYARARQRSPPRRRSPSPMRMQANFPSRNDPKSPSPRRLARDMKMKICDRSRSRSRSRGDRRQFVERQSEFSGHHAPMRMKPKPRSPSPDPPGPVKNATLVKNPFYRPNRSPSAESPPRKRGDDGVGGYYGA